MSMVTWAEREIELACKRERKTSGTPDGEWDYGCACYESALKALKSFAEEGHSGMSISITKYILNRLIDGKPLTPITEEDGWNCILTREGDGTKVYRCKRMSGFFKEIHPDRTITYYDTNRTYCVSVGSSAQHYDGFINDIVNKMYPITLPYMPADNPIKVVCEESLVDPAAGDYDTLGILYLIDSEGNRVEINRFFKEKGNTFVEISVEEYAHRKMISNDWRAKATYLNMRKGENDGSL